MRSPGFTGRMVGILIFIASFLDQSLSPLIPFSITISNNTITLFPRHYGTHLIDSLLEFAILFISILIFLLIYPRIKEQSRRVALFFACAQIANFVAILFLAFTDLYAFLYTHGFIDAFNQAPGSLENFIDLLTRIKLYGNNFLAFCSTIYGMLFCYSMFQSRIVPRFFSAWGFLGFACSALGGLFVLTVVLPRDIDAAAIILLSSIPNLLWALIAFPLWLIIKGFNPPAPQPCKQAS
jgi:hypothetical protein